MDAGILQDRSLVIRFWSCVDRAGSDDCWPWKAGKTGRGYGGFRVSGRQLLAHRLAYLISGGTLADGEVVRHLCDNPPCCNPSHLLSGTAKQNSHDAVQRNRLKPPSGLRHARSKFSAEQIVEMRIRFLFGEPKAHIAKAFGSHEPLVDAIVHGLSYRDVPMPTRDAIRDIARRVAEDRPLSYFDLPSNPALSTALHS